MAIAYQLFLEPEVHTARRLLPGHMRQRIGRLLTALTTDPRPPESDALDVSMLVVPPGVEARRIRVEHWRIVYAVNDGDRWVWALGLYRRPPYSYDDLSNLLQRLP